jgi:hypothetical protein
VGISARSPDTQSAPADTATREENPKII